MLKLNFITVLVGLFSVNLNAQTLITDVTATASSEHHPVTYSATHAVDGSGLYLGSYPNQIHHGGNHGGVGNSVQMIWLSEEPNDEWFKVDLGDRYAVETLRIWNGSFRGAIDTDSIKDVDIYYSTELSDPGSNFTDPNSSWKLFGSHTFAMNPVGSGTHDYAKTEELALGDIDARWIALDIKNNYGFTNWVSIGELQFDGSRIPDTDEDFLDEDEARDILREAPGVMVIDKRDDGGYVTPIECAGDYATFISRLRQDSTIENGLNLWCVSDNLRKGAALNAVQIAETLGQRVLKKG